MDDFEKMMRQIICEKSFVGALLLMQTIANEKAELFAGKDIMAAKIWQAYADRTGDFANQILVQV